MVFPSTHRKTFDTISVKMLLQRTAMLTSGSLVVGRRVPRVWEAQHSGLGWWDVSGSGNSLNLNSTNDPLTDAPNI